MNKQNVKNKINNVISSPKITNLVVIGLFILLLCKGCDVEKNSKNNAEEIAGAKKEIANLKRNDSILTDWGNDLESRIGAFGKTLDSVKQDNADLRALVDSCCCDCNKQTKLKATEESKKKSERQPAQSGPVVVHDTVLQVVRDTVVLQVVRDTVAERVKEPEPVERGFKCNLYVIKHRCR